MNINETYLYHYVYNIEHIKTGREYIGSRSSNISPEEDIINYKSSSSDKAFKRDQEIHPDNYEYTILEVLKQKRRC